MLDHHLQRSIVYKLAFQDKARFSDLKPDGVENKLFTYHLQKVLQSGLIEKSEEGLYSLSTSGRRYSTGAIDKQKDLIIQRAHSVIIAVVRRKSDGAWLLYERGTHPLLGYRGFLHCNPVAELDAVEATQRQVQERTGLKGEFRALGGGYMRVYLDDHIESYTHFTLVYCDDINGELAPTDPKASYFWVQDIDYTDKNLFPGTKMLHDAYLKREPFYVEKSYYLKD